MSRTITMSLFPPAPWNAMGLDAALDQCIDGAETRNEWPSEHRASEGEMFATLENYVGPDGVTYHVLFWTTYCNDWSPWTSDSTHATLYRTDDADDMEEFAADIAEWEDMPELDPCYSPDEDTDEEEGDNPTAPHGWDSV